MVTKTEKKKGLVNESSKKQVDAAIAAEITVKPDVTSDTKINNAPAESATAVGGAAIPESEVTERMVKIVPEAEAETTVVNNVPTLSMSGYGNDVNLKMGTKIETTLEYVVTPERKHIFWKSKRKIRNFINPYDYMEAELELTEQIRRDYDVMLHNVPTTLASDERLGDADHRITAPGYLGLNYSTLIKDLSIDNFMRASIISSLKHKFKTVDVDDSNVPVNATATGPRQQPFKEKQFMICHPNEHKIIQVAQTYNELNLINPKTMHDFLTLLNTAEHQIKPLNRAFDPRIDRTYFEPLNDTYRYVMDKSPRARDLTMQSVFQWLQTAFPAPGGRTIETWTMFAEALEVSSTKITQRSKFPRAIQLIDAQNLFYRLLMAMSFTRWVVLDCSSSVSITTPDLNTVVACVMAKVMIPFQCLTAESVTLIDNYLFLYFIPLLPRIRPEVRDYINRTTSDYQLLNNSKNFLSQLLLEYRNTGLTTLIDSEGYSVNSDLISLLYTDLEGKGWCGNGQHNPMPIPDNVRKFISTSRTWHWIPYFGVDSLSVESELSTFDLAARIFRTMSNQEFTRSSDNIDHKALSTILCMMFVPGSRKRVQEMRCYVNKINRAIGTCSLAYPIPGDEIQSYTDGHHSYDLIGSRYPIEFNIAGATSLPFTIDWDKHLTIGRVDFNMIKMGWNMIHYYTQLTELTHYIRDNLTSKYVTSTDRFNRTMEKMTADMPLAAALKHYLGAKPYLYDLMEVIPPKEMIDYDSKPRIILQNLIRSWIREEPYLFGYTNEFYYIPQVFQKDYTESKWEISKHVHDWDVYNEDKLYDIRFKVNADIDVKKKVSWQDLVDILNVGSDWRKLIQDANQDQYVIEFDFPVTLDSTELSIEAHDFAFNNTPYDYANRTAAIKKLTSFYRLMDASRYVDGDPEVYQYRQLYGHKHDFPLLPFDYFKPSDNVYEIITWKEKGLRIYDDFQFTQVISS